MINRTVPKSLMSISSRGFSLGTVLLFLSTCLVAYGENRSLRPAQERPNIILILADDLGYGDLGSYGQELIHTPNLDQLAQEGMRFTQAYSGASVCTPSRAVLMTGFHMGHAVARDNIPHYPTYLSDADVTVAEVLQQAGYRSGGVGKWALGDAGTEGRATRQGFDMWFGYLNQDHAHYYYPEYLDDGEGRLELPGNSRTREHYSHDLFAERALDFIKASASEPFFLYAAFTLPHFASPEEDPTELPVPTDAPYTDRSWSQQAKNYAAMVTRLDRDVGRIVKLVDDLGLGENTLIIVTGDNGPWEGLSTQFRSSGPLRGGKRELYEGGIRVPLLARWKGVVPAAAVSQEVIAFQDLLPTLAELAGTAPVAGIDGISVANAFRGKPVLQRHRYLYWDYGHNREAYHQAVRLGDWKGVRHGSEGPVELYYLGADIGETKDLAEQYPEIVSEIREIMRTAATPDARYEVGKRYDGSAIWKRADHWGAR